MIKIGFDVTGAVSTMQNILDDGRNLPMDEVALLLLHSVEENFEREGRPDPWMPRIEDPENPWPLLNKTGNLLGSLQAVVHGDVAGVATDVAYALYLDSGTVKMVDRPFMMIQDEDLDQIEEILANHFEHRGGERYVGGL